MKKTLCIIGSSNLDHVVRVPNFPKPGQTITASDYQLVYGGKGANQAVAAIKMGTSVDFISALGADDSGQSMLKYFADLGINVEAVKTVNDQTTGLAMIQVSDSGENTIAIVAGANQRVDAEAIKCEKTRIENADMILLQLETPQDGIEKVIDIAYLAGKKVILNPAPARNLPDNLLEKLWLITPNETEAEVLTGISVQDESSAQLACQALRDKGVKEVIITMGKHGVYYQSAVSDGMHAGFPVEVVDTTAAGDTFNGALASILLKCSNMDDAIRFAQAASALSVQNAGAQPSIPTITEVTAFLQERI